MMLQMWRLQQVAQPLTLAMLSVTISLQVWGFVKWRNELLADPAFGVPLILIPLVLMIWLVAVAWDLKLRMWREQQTVLVERNPYAKEKMSSKEVALYYSLWLPLMRSAAKGDSGAMASHDALRKWLRQICLEDRTTAKDTRELLVSMGLDISDFDRMMKEK